MKRWAVLVVLFCACSNEAAVPDGVLPPSRFSAVLYDAIRADELTDMRQLQDSAFRNFGKRTALYDTVLRVHNLTKDQLDQSLRFYQGRPDLLKPVLEELQKLAAADTPSAGTKKPLRAQ